MSSSTTASLDSMPTEIKLKILKNIPNTKTLYCLIRASPTIHAFYLSAREELLTQVTINELPDDMIETFQEATVLEFGFNPLTVPSWTFKSAFGSLCFQLRMKHTPIFPVNECHLLKRLEDVVAWRRVHDKEAPLPGPLPDHYWRDYTCHYFVHVKTQEKTWSELEPLMKSMKLAPL